MSKLHKKSKSLLEPGRTRGLGKGKSAMEIARIMKYQGINEAEWINEFVQETHVQDIAHEQEQVIRGFLAKLINDTYSRNFRAMSSSVEQAIENNNLESRSVFCLDRDLISFLKRKGTDILIMHDILKEMRGQKITHISTVAELRRMLQCDIKPTKMGAKTVKVAIIKKIHGIHSSFITIGWVTFIQKKLHLASNQG